MKSLQNRTTIRRYKADDVSEQLLNGLLEQAARTQTIRQFGIRKCPKKLVISLLFCNFIVENQ